MEVQNGAHGFIGWFCCDLRYAALFLFFLLEITIYSYVYNLSKICACLLLKKNIAKGINSLNAQTQRNNGNKSKQTQ